LYLRVSLCAVSVRRDLSLVVRGLITHEPCAIYFISDFCLPRHGCCDSFPTASQIPAQRYQFGCAFDATTLSFAVYAGGTGIARAGVFYNDLVSQQFFKYSQ
jgi:hypothetical protein